MDDSLLDQLLHTSQPESARALAARYAPQILFDHHEPFFPLAVGYTIWEQDGTSPSYTAGRTIELAPAGAPPARLAIEYAIWWDWDIGHLYELEHVWVFVDHDGRVVRGEASWHGEYNDMRAGGRLALAGDRLIVYSEPGKHAFAPTPQWFEKRWQGQKRTEAGALAGMGGVLVASYLKGQVTKTPYNDLLARSYLAQRAFVPSWHFDRPFVPSPEMLVPWPALREWIPRRVNHWLERLAHEIPPHYRFLRIGHRGARAHAPDNTLLGVRRAAELGADMVEMDLQRTADGQIAVIHDSYLTTPDGRVLPVQHSTLSDLQSVDLGGGERVPTWSEMLRTCEQERLGAYVEIKDGTVIDPLIESLHGQDWAGNCLIGSFRPDWLAEIGAALPQIPTSVLFASPHVDAVALAQAVGARYVHPCWERFAQPSSLLTPEWITRVRQAELGVIVWHEERPAEIAVLRKLGIDGICSDAPELLLGSE